MTTTLFAPLPDRGLLRLTGADRTTFLHNMTTNDVKRLAVGAGMPAAIVNQRGQVLDWVDVHAGADALWVTTGPGRTAEVLAWLDKYLITEDVAIADLTAETARFLVTGADAPAVLGAAPWTLAEPTLAGRPVHVLGTTGLGAPGFVVVAPAADAATVAAALRAAGAVPAEPAELEARRVAAGVPAPGRELTERTNPWEARLDGSVSLAKGCYLGQEVVARLQAYDKVQRLLVGLEVPAGAGVAAGNRLLDPADEAGERPIGEVTSVVAPPDAGAPAVLGFVKRGWAEPGKHITLETAGGAKISAMIADRWFWAPGAGERPLA